MSGFTPDSAVETIAGCAWVIGRKWGAGAGCVYLDGTTDATLARAGLQHPRKRAAQDDYALLRGYSEGEPLDERRTPQAWLEWADAKGFSPYWLMRPASAAKPVSRQAAQEKLILATLREMGYDPQALPVAPSGKRGVKAQVRARLPRERMSNFVFNKAWQRLRDYEDIKDA